MRRGRGAGERAEGEGKCKGEGLLRGPNLLVRMSYPYPLPLPLPPTSIPKLNQACFAARASAVRAAAACVG